MDCFKEGITGFYSAGVVIEHSSYEVEKFVKRIRYPYLLKGKIEEPHQSSNYYRFTVENRIEKRAFDILIHGFFWIIASITSESSWMNLEFIDLEEGLKMQIPEIPNRDLIFLEKQTLYTQVPKEEFDKLDKEEIQQIKYWESKNYGEIIFNGYD